MLGKGYCDEAENKLQLERNITLSSLGDSTDSKILRAIFK